jgi:nucleoside-diphosphate-sugar epimerase
MVSGGRALVTGATGFLGSRVVAGLGERGYDVRVLARPTSDLSRLAASRPEVVHGDVTDRGSVERAVHGVDVVIHTAALVELGADPARMRAVNVEGTRHVLEAAAAAGAVAVHVSSVAALGPTDGQLADETWWNPDPPVVGYEVTKREAHLVARELAAAGAPVRIGSPGGIYGYGDTSSMARLIEVLVNYPLPPVGYLPDLVQSLVNVDDCADALVRMAELADDGDEFVVCAEAVTFREWFRAIARGAGRRPPVVHVPTSWVRWSGAPATSITRWVGRDPAPLADTLALATRSQAFSGAKARAQLGWAPRTLDQGMAEMAASLQADRAARRAGRSGILPTSR